MTGGLAAVVMAAANAAAPELWVGAATVDITPPRPVALVGQFRARVSKGVDTPLTAAAVAIEARADAALQALVFWSRDGHPLAACLHPRFCS